MSEEGIEVTVFAPDGKEVTVIAPSKVKVRSLLRKAGDLLGVNLELISQAEGASTVVVISNLDVSLEVAGIRDGSTVKITSVPEEDLIKPKH